MSMPPSPIPTTVLALVHDPDGTHAWAAALALGDRLILVRLTLNRLGDPDLQPVLDLLDGDDRAELGKLIVVVPRLDDRDDQACLVSHVRCSVTTPSRMEMLVLGDGDVTRLLDLPEGAVGAFDSATIRPVIERDLGVALPSDLDAGSLRAVAFAAAGRREVARRAAMVRVIGVQQSACQPRHAPAGATASEGALPGTTWAWASGAVGVPPNGDDHDPRPTPAALGVAAGSASGAPRAVDQDLLTADDVATVLQISRSAAYRLAARVPACRVPGVGLRFRRQDLEAYIVSSRRPAVSQPGCRVQSLRRGMRVAHGDDDEIVIDGMTRRELKEKAGW